MKKSTKSYTLSNGTRVYETDNRIIIKQKGDLGTFIVVICILLFFTIIDWHLIWLLLVVFLIGLSFYILRIQISIDFNKRKIWKAVVLYKWLLNISFYFDLDTIQFHGSSNYRPFEGDGIVTFSVYIEEKKTKQIYGLFALNNEKDITFIKNILAKKGFLDFQITKRR